MNFVFFKFVINEEYQFLRSQNATTKEARGKHRKYIPYVFTEQGIAMLSGIIRSESAIKMSIHIMNAFVSMRKF